MLACTSSADLEELENIAPLEAFLKQRAGVVYRHASGIRPLRKDECLYIVTGCIKSDGWGIAAFQDTESGEILRLSKRFLGDSSPNEGKVYDWVDRGPAEARLWPNTPEEAGLQGGKNQSLFLQGFKLAFSSPFRARMDNWKHTVSLLDSDESSDGHMDSLNGPPGRNQSRSAGTSSGASSSNFSGSRNASLSDEVRIDPFPKQY